MDALHNSVTCEECGEPFVVNRKRTRFCGRACSNKANSRVSAVVTRKGIDASYEGFVIRGGADECWGWSGSLVGYGYGCIKRGSRTIYAHRYAYERAKGAVPPGLIVRHTCDNPVCSNPDHLVVGTPADNSRDMVQRGRALTGRKNPQNKLSEEDVTAIKLRVSQGFSQRQIAGQFGVCQQLISRIMLRKTWRHV
jgi:hypothetical protein